jgi:hypothetical protein
MTVTVEQAYDTNELLYTTADFRVFGNCITKASFFCQFYRDHAFIYRKILNLYGFKNLIFAA